MHTLSKFRLILSPFNRMKTFPFFKTNLIIKHLTESKSREIAPNEISLDSKLNKFQHDLSSLKEFNLKQFLEVMGMFNKVDNEEFLEQTQERLLNIIKSTNLIHESFSNKVQHKDFRNYFINIHKLRRIDQSHLKFLSEVYLKLKDIDTGFTIDDKILLFDSFYYFLHFLDSPRVEAVSPILDHLIQELKSNLMEMSPDELSRFLHVLVFFPEGYVNIFTPLVTKMMNGIIQKDSLSFTEKLENLICYPKIISLMNDNKTKDGEINKLKEFLLNLDSTNVNSDLLIGMISNFINYANKDREVFEFYIPYFYYNIAGIHVSLLFDVFFGFLYFKPNDFSNKAKAMQLFNLLDTTLINTEIPPNVLTHITNTKESTSPSLVKEDVYAIEIRQKFKETFNEFKKTKDAQDIPPGLMEILHKACYISPINLDQYTPRLFETLCRNYEKYLKSKI